jgi:tetratricopeptide (TPR) repeat protein
MTGTNRTRIKQWTRNQAILLSVVCLLLGIAGGWFARGSQTHASAGSTQAANLPAPAVAGPASPAPSSAQLKEMADAKVAPLLAKLRTDPNNPGLLTGIGNIYYDAQQYSIAVGYYGRSLKTKPSDAAVRTDMATAYWYMGSADVAIAEFNKALTYAPNNPNALFNRGLVKWKGKLDSAGALADWQKLLATNPNYEHKDKVEDMMTEAKKDTAPKTGLSEK